MKLMAKLSLDKVLQAPNVCDLLDDEDVKAIGAAVVDAYRADRTSRSEWEDRNSSAMKLALQIAEKKTFPWEDASNVKLPLITIAALQYSAKAYASLVTDPQVVQCRVVGDDMDGEKADTADRISQHMSYQVLEEDTCWEDEMDRGLTIQPLLGCMFKKSYFDPHLKHNVSEVVSPFDLILPYKAKSIEQAARATHLIYLSKNVCFSRVKRGVFCDEDSIYETQRAYDSTVAGETQDETQGSTAPVTEMEDADLEFLEQHRFLDLDGDGYAEPYVVTVRLQNAQVARIVARFHESGITRNSKGEVVQIEPQRYFTSFPFLPSPDGGIYGLGFGVLLGPLSNSADTIINQIVDAGTMSNTAGGFLGRGARIRSGDQLFKPWEWKRVDATGDDLRKSMVPLSVREPSVVLFQLLGMLINYGERVAGATEAQVGENPGQNTPAETSRNMIEQGSKVFSSIVKRTWRAMKREFQLLYELNALYLPASKIQFMDPETGKLVSISKVDYMDDVTIRPAADPTMVSDAMRIQQAQGLLTAASANPGLYNQYEANRRYLKALRVPDVDAVLPDPKGPNAIPQGPSEKMQIETMKAQIHAQQTSMKVHLGMVKLLNESEVNKARILNLEAQAALYMEQASGTQDQLAVQLIQQKIAAAKAHQDGIYQAMTLLDKIMNGGSTDGTDSSIGSGVSGLDSPSDDPSVPQGATQDAGNDQGGLGG